MGKETDMKVGDTVVITKYVYSGRIATIINIEDGWITVKFGNGLKGLYRPDELKLAYEKTI